MGSLQKKVTELACLAVQYTCIWCHVVLRAVTRDAAVAVCWPFSSVDGCCGVITVWWSHVLCVLWCGSKGL
jgi:hypothetical protein